MLDKNLRDECYVPSDGIVMPAEKYVLREGDTAFDLLEKDYKVREDTPSIIKAQRIIFTTLCMSVA